MVFDRESNCLLCHAVPGAPRAAGNIGPSLEGVARRMKAAEMRARIVDSRRYNPDTVMPPYFRKEGLTGVAAPYRGKTVLTAEQIDDVVSYLLTLR